MKKIIVLATCFALIITFNILAQDKSVKPFPPSPPDPNEKWMKCIYLKKYTILQRLNFYPFNKASSVKLISFKEYDSTKISTNKLNDYTVKDFASRQYNAHETINLSKKQITKLTDVLFNNSFLGKKYEEEAMCYVPRNAILFCNKKGKVIEMIEICFECNQYKKSSLKVKTGDFCVGKYELLKVFFQKNGIKYGTENIE